MIITDGGIRMPSVPPAVMTPEASFTSYPAFSMGLNAMTPISTTTAPTRPLALHHVAHQHEQRDGDQDVVGHGAVGALNHQIEHAVVGPGMRRVIERDVAKKYA